MSLLPKHIKKNGKVDLWDLGPAKGDEGREQWEKTQGAHVIEFWPVDAVHALAIAPDRFVHKLPSGVKPGPAQALVERERAEQTGGQPDPHFGESR